MGSGSFAEYLAGLDRAALAGVLRVRPDVRVEPVPRGFGQLAQRLGGADSLVAALRSVNRDVVVVGQAVAALGSSATVGAVARLLGASERDVGVVVDELCGWGLAWLGGGLVCLPERLMAHWADEIGGGRPAASIARSVLVEDVRSAAAGLGVEAAGLRKVELIDRLGEALSDARAVVEKVRGLPRPARDRLDQLRRGYGMYYPGYGGPRQPGGVSADRMLAAAGLVLRVNGHWEMPREVGVAAWLAERGLRLTGRPEIPMAGSVPVAAQAVGHDLLRAVMAVLDEAGSGSITALKRGGIGPRERSRLSARLALAAEVVLLAIDLAFAAGLLGRTDSGYAPTERYPSWRAARPAEQWAALAIAWFTLEYAPTSRETQEDKELPPPLPLVSAAGALRRALLRAAAGGRSVREAGAQIDWFCPLHGYEEGTRRTKVAAAVREAELLGVAAGDQLTGLGEQLLAEVDDTPRAAVGELAARVAGLLPELPCTVILQSDLTAVVSGQPTMAVSRVLGAAAASEVRGAAAVWRFSPASVRQAMDAGWTAAQLLEALTAVSDRPLPQPLEYLITDVARRHGQVRVRGLRSCVLADEITLTEILGTRSLAKLQLSRLAPTVLASPCEVDEVLTRLRAAGLSPVAENSTGGVIVEVRPEHRAATAPPSERVASRARLGATELAERLLTDPDGDAGAAHTSDTFERLADLNPDLDDAELVLLADAVDHQRDILITYRSKTGNRTVRSIQPQQLYGRWLDSWCHLRDAQREFTVANIESVAPVG